MTDQNFFVYKNDLLCSDKMGSCTLCHWLWLHQFVGVTDSWRDVH